MPPHEARWSRGFLRQAQSDLDAYEALTRIIQTGSNKGLPGNV